MKKYFENKINSIYKYQYDKFKMIEKVNTYYII